MGIEQRTKESPHAENYFDFVSKQVFVVDPRGQGFGLRDYAFLDAYANKFLILAGSRGLFISPQTVPNELLAYYGSLGIDVPPRSNILALENDGSDRTLIERIAGDGSIRSTLSDRKGTFIVPYMVTDEVEMLARQHGLKPLVRSSVVGHMADKADFQEELSSISPDIARDFGYDVSIRAERVKANDEATLREASKTLSQGGIKDVVVVKPKSASGLGIFVIRAGSGDGEILSTVSDNFREDEEVLLEEFVNHNHSPSMQGARLPEEAYQHLYFGRQIILYDDGRVEYDGSQVPFGPETVNISPREIERLKEVHEALGEKLITEKDIAGVGGFDAVADISEDGIVRNFKVTELNLHLPSTLAVFAAIRKLFPDGFPGIAHNFNVPLGPSDTPTSFIRDHADILIKAKQQYGIFPLNLSYPDKVDVILFGRDQEQLEHLLAAIKQ